MVRGPSSKPLTSGVMDHVPATFGGVKVRVEVPSVISTERVDPTSAVPDTKVPAASVALMRGSKIIMATVGAVKSTVKAKAAELDPVFPAASVAVALISSMALMETIS